MGKSTNDNIRTIIIDDELPARIRIAELLTAQTKFEIVKDCSSGKDALKAIRSHSPDLIFLDIELQDMSGFDVLKQISKSQMPLIIFITAFDEFAIKAFDFHALDYLLKPFSDERFYGALDKAKIQIKTDEIETLRDKIDRLLSSFREQAPQQKSQPIRKYKDRFTIKNSRKISFILAKHISSITSEGPYVSLNVADRSFLMRETLKGIEKDLDPAQFVRIHRSTIVNINHIKEMHSHSHGEYFVVLNNGKKLKLSRGYKENAEKLLSR